MKRTMTALLVFTICLVCVQEDAEGIGRGGGGRVGNIGGGGGGGGRIGGGGISRPSLPSGTPSISNRPSLPSGISRPTTPKASLPSLPKGTPSLPKIDRPISRPDFNLPSNPGRPITLPKVDRPPVVSRPSLPDIKGKLPDIKGKLPSAKLPSFPDVKLPKDGFPNLKDRPPIAMLPDVKGKLPDLKGKLPGGIGAGDRPIRLPGAGIDRPSFDRPSFDRPGLDRPSRDDIAGWLGGRPGLDRPPVTLPGGDRPIVNRPKLDKSINADFSKRWQTAIKRGDINIDLSKNVNFQNLVNRGNIINNRLRPQTNNWFNPHWWTRHVPPRLPWWHFHHFPRPWHWWWRPVTWPAATAWMTRWTFGPPVYFDFGSTIVIQNDTVFVNEEPVASAPVFAQQAIELATVEPPPEETKVEWLPLGTFALLSNKDDDDPDVVLQLALSKDGLVSGVMFNRATEKSTAIEGRVHPETQRVAIRDPDNPDVVLEVGLFNLTKEATSCLVHFGTMRTQQWFLIRLDAPEEKTE